MQVVGLVVFLVCYFILVAGVLAGLVYLILDLTAARGDSSRSCQRPVRRWRHHGGPLRLSEVPETV
jgi:hypothetical protein